MDGKKICDEEIDRKGIKDIHLTFVHASNTKLKFFLEGSWMNNNLRIKDITEIIENVIANCTACNETGKVANIRNLLTPRSKDLKDSVAIRSKMDRP